MTNIFLASQSPSRKKILKNLGFEFTVEPSFAEEYFLPEKNIEENAIHLATIKAEEIFKKNPESIVIGCDTIMADPDGNFLEKPRDKNDAENMMQNRSGKKEILVSGLAIFSPHGNFLQRRQRLLYGKK